MPISAPKPNSPPSANWVEALCSTIAESTSSRNRRGGGRVLGHDRIGVVRAVVVDMRDRLVDAVDDLGRDDRVVDIRCPSRRRSPASPADRLVCTASSPRTSQPASISISTSGFSVRRRAGAIDQQGFGRAADAGTAHLGVQHDRLRHVEIGGAIDIDVVDAFQMREHRHARFGLDARDQALAAARHDHVDAAVQAAQQQARPRRGRGSAPA